MPRSTRVLLIAAPLAVILLALGLLVARQSPPRAARLLPEADAIVYANLSAIRLATHLDEKPVPHSPEYQRFIDATGILFERDLDSAAFALHRMPNPNGPNGLVAYSEIFIGRFDPKRLSGYLASIATARENYAGHDIYTVSIDEPDQPIPTGRLLRVTQLDSSTIAASNAPTPEQIHAILDRFRATSSPFSGSTLLTGLYPEVPMLSPVWGIGSIGLPFSEDGRISVFGLHLPLPDTTPFVASLRYTTGLHLRIEQIAADDAEAARSTQKLKTLLTLFRQFQQFRTIDPDEAPIEDLTNSIAIEQKGDRAILTATIPLQLVRKVISPSK
jgi:hypothetical protein